MIPKPYVTKLEDDNETLRHELQGAAIMITVAFIGLAVFACAAYVLWVK